jgi:AraC-like DNA-binding protein
MLLSHREVRFLDTGALYEVHAAVTTGFRVRVIAQKRVVADDALFLRSIEKDRSRKDRAMVSVILSGAALVRAGEHQRWANPGDVTMVRTNAVSARHEGDTFRALVIEWDEGTLGPRPRGFDVVQLGAGDLARAEEDATRLTDASIGTYDAACAVARLVALLRAASAPFVEVSPDALVEPVSEQTQSLSRAIDRALSTLEGQPMRVDLQEQTGFSDRHVSRLVSRLSERYGDASGGWGEMRKSWRLRAGVLGMSAPGATTESVAAAVGYSSPTALCRAFAEAGLPSPGSVPKVLRQLA